MSWIRASAVAALMAGVWALGAGAALACELTSFSVGSGDPVRPGDLVPYTLNVRATPDSPGDSAFTVSAGSHVLVSGFATPSSNGGEWSASGSFRMPDLGEDQRQVTISVTLQTGGYMSRPVLYDGTPAPAPSETSSDGSATTPAPASVPAGQPGAATTVGDPVRPQSPSDAARPAVAVRAVPVASARRARARTTGPRAAGPARPPNGAATPDPVASRRAASRRAVRQSSARSQHAPQRRAPGARTPRAPARVSQSAALAPGASTATGDARVAVVARAWNPASAGNWLAALALALRMSGGGYCWDVPPVTRRLIPDPDPEDDAIEAELQALLATCAGSERRAEPAPLVLA